MEIEFTTHAPLETEALGESLAPLLKSGDVIAFYGDLGAGKTTFMRGLARGMGSSDEVSSPTFVLMHIYEGRLPVYHFDAYRLNGAEDLWNIGADEYIYGEGVACVEWAERAEEIFPADRLEICLRRPARALPADDDPEACVEDAPERTICFRSRGARSLAILERLNSTLSDLGKPL